MINPKVSIVIPVYNGENYLKEAIDSALAQTYKNIEIIVVNDGSTDDTRSIALSYGDKIRYFEKENGGVSTALNYAIEKMDGDFFSWLSHDDKYNVDKIELEIEAYQDNPSVAAVYSNYSYIDMQENIVYTPDSIDTLGYRDFCTNGFCAVSLNMINGLSLLIPKKLFDKYGKFDENLRAVQDYKKWDEMFSDNQLAYIGKTLVQSRKHPKQVTHTFSGARVEGEALFLEIVKKASDEKLQGSSLNLYSYFQKALVHYGRINYKSIHDYIISELLQLKDMEDTEKVLNGLYEFKKWLLEITEHRDIYLYCAGNQGKALIEELSLRGVEIKGISDSNEEVWGKDISGYKCICPDDIPMDAILLVTKLDGQWLAENLRDKGFNHVVTNEDIQGMIMKTAVPVDNLVKLKV